MAITATSSTGQAVFTASGLASGMDTASIVDQLVALESRPITLLQNQQSAMKTQVSLIATIMSKLSALRTAADDLGTNGVFATKVTSTNTAFTATASSTAAPGRYSIDVEQMARAAKWRSTAFASGETVAGGTLTLTVQGKAYDPITIADRTSLQDVAYAIRQSGAPVSAVVLNDGTQSYLSITSQDTGFPLTGVAGDALNVAFTPTGTPAGKLPAFAEIEAAQNARVIVDQLQFTRQTNSLTDALPGITLDLSKAVPGVAEDLVVTTDSDGTQKRLQTFVDAYNGVMSLLRKQLAVGEATDRSTSLVGFASIRSLQAQLRQVVVSEVGGLANVRALADVGLKTSKDDGSLSIDAPTLKKALARDPAAVNSLFSTRTTGISALVDTLVDRNTRPVNGSLTISQASLNKRVTDLDDVIATMRDRVDSYRQRLLAQFNAMETTISGLKAMGTFLTNWSNQASANSSSK